MALRSGPGSNWKWTNEVCDFSNSTKPKYSFNHFDMFTPIMTSTK